MLDSGVKHGRCRLGLVVHAGPPLLNHPLWFQDILGAGPGNVSHNPHTIRSALAGLNRTRSHYVGNIASRLRTAHRDRLAAYRGYRRTGTAGFSAIPFDRSRAFVPGPLDVQYPKMFNEPVRFLPHFEGVVKCFPEIPTSGLLLPSNSCSLHLPSPRVSLPGDSFVACVLCYIKLAQCWHVVFHQRRALTILPAFP